MHSTFSNPAFALHDANDDAVAELKLSHQDDALDEALRESFPASDPIAVSFTGVAMAKKSVLSINGGSSSIKFAMFGSDESALRIQPASASWLDP